MDVEQRQLLVPVHGIAGVIAVERDGSGGARKLRQYGSTSAAFMRATSMRDGAFSRWLVVGSERRSQPPSGTCPQPSLHGRSVRSLPQSSPLLVTAGDRKHAEAQHNREQLRHCA